MKNNFVLAIVAGLVAAVIGGALWAAIAVLIGMQIGYVAIGIGALVGFAIRFAGKGETQLFALLGGALALFGCVLGNFMTIIGLFSKEASLGIVQSLGSFPYDRTIELMTLAFSPMDLLFYAIAGWAGWKYAVDEEQIDYSDFEPENVNEVPIFGKDKNNN